MTTDERVDDVAQAVLNLIETLRDVGVLSREQYSEVYDALPLSTDLDPRSAARSAPGEADQTPAEAVSRAEAVRRACCRVANGEEYVAAKRIAETAYDLGRARASKAEADLADTRRIIADHEACAEEERLHAERLTRERDAATAAAKEPAEPKETT